MTDMESIQRVLFISPKVHIYAIPPLTSSSGYKAGDWKVDEEKSCIFTARIRIIETATEEDGTGEEKVRTDVRLEDPKTGDLFANCPYEGPHCVEQVVDSSRFFALRVTDGGRKATLGIGFEERGEAFDFGVSLQEVQRHTDIAATSAANKGNDNVNYSLGDTTIYVTIGGKGRRKAPGSPSRDAGGGTSLPPLPPPPSAKAVKRRQSRENLGELGFDDDDFGDFV